MPSASSSSAVTDSCPRRAQKLRRRHRPLPNRFSAPAPIGPAVLKHCHRRSSEPKPSPLSSPQLSTAFDGALRPLHFPATDVGISSRPIKTTDWNRNQEKERRQEIEEESQGRSGGRKKAGKEMKEEIEA
ncbi:hypothetical protein M0R45_032424 [Rubus argutus]|uniref:Uncharacterized protein n=1 Tax=Rubus argutus TaxID=59490 RepID=A0AAW1WGH6_RUBAR